MCLPKILDGMVCTAAAQCLSGVCNSYYRDQDGDGQGTSTMVQKLCGNSLPTGYVTNADDCCDTNAMVKKPLNRPGDPPVEFRTDPALTCTKKYDYDCNGTEEKEWPTLAACVDVNGSCPSIVQGYWNNVIPCGPNTTGELFGGACMNCCGDSSCINEPQFNKPQGCR